MNRDRLSAPRRLGLGSMVLAFLCCPFQGLAQPQPADPRGEIGQAGHEEGGTTVSPLTVVASHEPSNLPEKVSKFVAAHGVPGRIDQLSRWGVPLCPKTEGLSAPFDSYVTVRIKQVAAFVKAPVDNHPRRNFACKTNVLVVFTTKPQELMEDVRRRRPSMLGFHYAAQTERLAKFTRPMQAWYITGTRAGQDGELITDSEFSRLPQGTAGSRLTARIRNEIIGALVVIDANQIIGRQIGGLADNVSMLVMSHAGLSEGCSDLPTVLDFMVKDCSDKADVEALTDYDVAYLKALYAVDPEAYLHAQRSEIATRVLQDLKSSPPESGSAPSPER